MQLLICLLCSDKLAFNNAKIHPFAIILTVLDEDRSPLLEIFFNNFLQLGVRQLPELLNAEVSYVF
jgi:hypothetical protein